MMLNAARALGMNGRAESQPSINTTPPLAHATNKRFANTTHFRYINNGLTNAIYIEQFKDCFYIQSTKTLEMM